jgi:hypothetical protein
MLTGPRGHGNLLARLRRTFKLKRQIVFFGRGGHRRRRGITECNGEKLRAVIPILDPPEVDDAA